MKYVSPWPTTTQDSIIQIDPVASWQSSLLVRTLSTVAGTTTTLMRAVSRKSAFHPRQLAPGRLRTAVMSSAATVGGWLHSMDHRQAFGTARRLTSRREKCVRRGLLTLREVIEGGLGTIVLLLRQKRRRFAAMNVKALRSVWLDLRTYLSGERSRCAVYMLTI